MASSEKPTGPGSSRHATPGGEAVTRSGPAARDRPSPPPNNRLPARERAYHDLKYRILEGRLPPGTSLLETEVANLLSMSRTPVREALIKLEEEGLVDVRPRHGITVRALSPEELEEICEVFSTLEVKAAQLLARRGLSDEEYARLDNLLNQMGARHAETRHRPLVPARQRLPFRDRGALRQCATAIHAAPALGPAISRTHGHRPPAPAPG